MNAVADKGLVNHSLLSEYMFIFSPLYQLKVVLVVSQLIHMRNLIHCFVKDFSFDDSD